MPGRSNKAQRLAISSVPAFLCLSTPFACVNLGSYQKDQVGPSVHLYLDLCIFGVWKDTLFSMLFMF